MVLVSAIHLPQSTREEKFSLENTLFSSRHFFCFSVCQDEAANTKKETEKLHFIPLVVCT